MEDKMIKVFAGSDTHCGHDVGLTPPEWQYKLCGNAKRDKRAKTQKALWKTYYNEINIRKPFDVAIWNADLIDGKGERSGGTEQITTDRNEQVKIAIRCIEEVNAPINLFTYGTGYHTGKEEDFEDQIVTHFKEKGQITDIEGHGFWKIGGYNFDVRHKFNRSSIPHGKATPLLREGLWSVLWKEQGLRDNVDILIRSHVHYYLQIDDPSLGHLAFVTPALQGFGSKYGARECSEVVHIGFIVFYLGEKISWEKVLFNTREQYRPAKDISLLI